MRRIAIIVASIVVALALVGGAFWEGISMGKAQAQSDQNSFFASRGFDPNNLPGGAAGGTGAAGGFGNGALGGRNGARRGAAGTIQKIDSNTITLLDNQGNTVTATLTGDAPIVKSVLGGKSDLAVGSRITVIGDRSGNNIAVTGIQISDLPDSVQGLFGAGRRATPTATP